MTTIFGKAERAFYNAFFIPDARERQRALDKWISSTIPVIQASVYQEIHDFVAAYTENTWTEEGWKKREEKLRKLEMIIILSWI